MEYASWRCYTKDVTRHGLTCWTAGRKLHRSERTLLGHVAEGFYGRIKLLERIRLTLSMAISENQRTSAEVSYAVAVLPDAVFARAVSRASLAISAQFENTNRIDEDEFPAHVSVHLSGTMHAQLDALMSTIDTVVRRTTFLRVSAFALHAGWNGFIGVRCEPASLRPFHDDVVRACADVHCAAPSYRPHLIARWHDLKEQQRALLDAYGSYKVYDRFDAHVSVAQVPEVCVPAALAIATDLIPLPQQFEIRAIQFVDIGHRNECWSVLREWPVDVNRPTDS